MVQEQLDKTHHSRGKGPTRGEALEKSAWEKFMRQRQGF